MNHCRSALVFSNNILCDNFYRRCTSGESFRLPITAKAEINNAHAKWLACGNVFCLYTERWGCCAVKTVCISSKRLPCSVYNKITVLIPPLPTLDCFSSLTVPPTPATIWPPTFCHHRRPQKKVRTGGVYPSNRMCEWCAQSHRSTCLYSLTNIEFMQFLP